MTEYDREHFFHALLDALDAPRNESNLLALHAWGECEGSGAAYNPLDTTQPEPGDNPYNSFESGGVTLHVWNYPDEETGVRATVETLRNGHYPHILAELEHGTGRVCFGAARDEMHVWGTNPDCIAQKLRGTIVAEVPEHTQPTQPHVTHEVPPRPFDGTIRDWVNRIHRHLQEREHPLPPHDEHLLKELVKEGRRVIALSSVQETEKKGAKKR